MTRYVDNETGRGMRFIPTHIGHSFQGSHTFVYNSIPNHASLTVFKILII